MHLDYRYGCALLPLSEAKDLALAQAAQRRYSAALAVAREEMPEAVATMTNALTNANQCIAAIQTTGHLLAQMSALETRLDQAVSPRAFGPPTAGGNLALFEQLLHVYHQDVLAGKVSETRKQALDSVLAQLRSLLQDPATDMRGLTLQGSRLRELLASMLHLVGETGQGTLRPGSRAHAVWQRLARLKLSLVSALRRPHLGSDEHTVGMELARRCGHADTYVHQVGQEDGATRQYEVDVLRPLACEVRAFSLRHHVTLAAPIWPSLPLPQNPNAVCFSGDQAWRQVLTTICAQNRLQFLAQPTLKDVATMRWDQLRTCHVAVCDFTAYTRPQARQIIDPARAGPVAVVAYELGIALTLGRAVVIVAKEGQDLPFDVDIEPVRLTGGAQDEARLKDALDEAMYGLQRGGEGSSISATRAYLERTFAGHESFLVVESLKLIDDKVARDPVTFRRFVEPVLGSAGASALQIVYPAWPGSYPPPHERRLFHVTAFGPAWAKDTMSIIAQACRAAKPVVEYIRGDQVLDPNILRSIWTHICQASHVVVDLTGMNANVALELGICHALGRKVFLMTQDSAVPEYFPSIAKERLHCYSLTGEPGLDGLRDALEQFLNSG